MKHSIKTFSLNVLQYLVVIGIIVALWRVSVDNRAELYGTAQADHIEAGSGIAVSE